MPGIFAIGDVIQGPMLAHKAEIEGMACVEYLANEFKPIDYNTIPGVIYTYPEVASVGKTEEEVQAAGIRYRKGKVYFNKISRAVINNQKEGFVKVLIDEESENVLGVHIIGPTAGEML